MCMTVCACSYDESIELCNVSVQLVYPEGSIEPYAGARVEMKSNTNAQVFVDSTDATGTARFMLPAGLYEARSSDTHITYDWRYIFNGTRNMVVVSPDSANIIKVELTMSRKRIVH